MSFRFFCVSCGECDARIGGHWVAAWVCRLPSSQRLAARSGIASARKLGHAEGGEIPRPCTPRATRTGSRHVLAAKPDALQFHRCLPKLAVPDVSVCQQDVLEDLPEDEPWPPFHP